MPIWVSTGVPAMTMIGFISIAVSFSRGGSPDFISAGAYDVKSTILTLLYGLFSRTARRTAYKIN